MDDRESRIEIGRSSGDIHWWIFLGCWCNHFFLYTVGKVNFKLVSKEVYTNQENIMNFQHHIFNINCLQIGWKLAWQGLFWGWRVSPLEPPQEAHKAPFNLPGGVQDMHTLHFEHLIRNITAVSLRCKTRTHSVHSVYTAKSEIEGRWTILNRGNICFFHLFQAFYVLNFKWIR